MKSVLINLKTKGLQFSIDDLDFLVQKNIAKPIQASHKTNIETYIQKVSSTLNYIDINLKLVSKKKKNNKIIYLFLSQESFTFEGKESNLYVYIIQKKDLFTAFYVDALENCLRENVNIFKLLTQSNIYKKINIESKNLTDFYVFYDILDKREYLSAKYITDDTLRYPLYTYKVFN